MPKVYPIQHNFNGGELSPYLVGRTDQDRYFTSVAVIKNFIPRIQGPLDRRGGFEFVNQTDGPNRLVPFEVNVNQSYILEFGNQCIHVYTPTGQVLAKQTTLTAQFGPNGGDMQLADASGLPSITSHFYPYLTINGVAVAYNGPVVGNTLQHCYTVGRGGYSVYWPTGTTVNWPYTIGTPYDTSVDDLWDLKFAQQGDVMYIVHPNHPPMKLARLADNNWTLITPGFQAPPMHDFDQDISGGSAGLTANASSSHYTADSPVFIAGDVGRSIVCGTGIAYINYLGGSTGTDPAGAVTYSDTSCTTVDQPNLTYYSPGQWKLRGSPKGYFAFGELSAGNWKSSRQLGVGVQQTAYSFSKFPTEDIAHPPFMDCFRASDAGKYILAGGACGQITQVISGNEVMVKLLSPITQTFSDTSGTIRAVPISGGEWEIQTPSFTSAWGYPRAVAFFQDRLWFAGTTEQPQTVWGSITGDYENFAKGNQDTDSLDLTINSGRLETIQWLIPYQGFLLCGTLRGEYAIGSGQAVIGGNGPAITPTNAVSLLQSAFGVSRIQAIMVENQVLYIQRSFKFAYEMSFNIQQSVLGSKDLTLFADLITIGGFKELVYYQNPLRCIFCTTQDHKLVGMVYKRDDDVWGWHRHFTGPNEADGFISIGVIPYQQGLADQLWAVVNRTYTDDTNFTGNSVYNIERMETITPVCTDASAPGNFATPQSKIGGMQYLYSQMVQVIGDGAYQGTQIVGNDGSVIINPPASYIEIGLAYNSFLQTLPLEIRGGQNVQGLLKRWNRVWVRLYNTVNVVINGNRVPFRKATMPMGQAIIPEYYEPASIMPITSDRRVEGLLQNDRLAQLSITQDIPQPCTIIAVFGEATIGEI